MGYGGRRDMVTRRQEFTRALILGKVVIWLDAYGLKIACCLGLGLALFFASIPIHEVGHWLVAKMLGISGSIHIYDALWGGGSFSPDYWPIFSPQNEVIAFAGGGFVALFVFILWLCLPHKRRWYVAVPLLGTVAWCLAVALGEML